MPTLELFDCSMNKLSGKSWTNQRRRGSRLVKNDLIRLDILPIPQHFKPTTTGISGQEPRMLAILLEGIQPQSHQIGTRYVVDECIPGYRCCHGR